MSDQNGSFSFRRLFGSLRPNSGTSAASQDPARPSDTAPFRVKSEDALVSEPLKRIWRILDPKRAGRSFLRRADIDPAEIVFALPYVALIEVHPSLRFRHRLVGTGFRDVLGFEATGLWTEEWPNLHQRGLIVRAYVATVEAREAIGFRSEAPGEGQPIHYEALLIPLSADDEKIDMLFLAGALIGDPGRTP